MNWLGILRVVLNAVAFAACSAGSNATVSSTNTTTGCVPADITERSTVHSEPELCLPYQAKFPDGYCKDILGYQPIYGRDSYELEENEMKMLRYQIAKSFVESSREKNGEVVINDNSYVVRQSCLDMVDDVYCHHYFKRCYISSRPPLICRETCEQLFFNVCDREFKIVEDFTNSTRRQSRLNYPYFFDIIDCKALPFRNESSNCYYPDHIRDELNILESQDCFYGDGRGYRGNRSVTVSGHTCQSWDAQCPHIHNITDPQIYKAIHDSGNLCRNPGGFAKDGPWCFTTNRTVRWEYCDVPKCAKRPPSSPPSNFRGNNMSSTSIKVSWGDVPKPVINGILLGFHVACERPNTTGKHVVDLSPVEHSWVFKGLEKFSNYSCWLRAYNNFGNGTWSDELVISTNEDVPDAPPESLKAWNLSSTSLFVQWNPIPFGYRNGKILRYKVEIKAEKQSRERHKATKYTEATSLTLRGLQKYSKYEVTVSGMTIRGQGPPRSKVVQTDEDVPEYPPKDITVFSQGTDTIQVDWSPVPPDYTNGELLGYKVLYSDVQDTSSVNSSLVSPKETHSKIKGLKTNTDYSVQVLAFTAKGNGPKSAVYFTRTSSDPANGKKVDPSPANSAKGKSIIVAAVFSGIIVFGVVFLVVYFVRKRRTAVSNSDNGNAPELFLASTPVGKIKSSSVYVPSFEFDLGTSCSVTPYAVSASNWINDIISTYRHGYETLDDENVPTTTRRPRYINIGADGLPDLPPHLRNMVYEFEQLYENTRYRRLQSYRRRGSLGNGHVNPVYDSLQRVISSTAPCPGNRCSNGPHATATTNKEHSTRQHHSVDLGVLRGFGGALQSNTCTVEMTEMGPVEQRRRRRFSVDMGQVREFIALREMKITTVEGNTASADNLETQEARNIDATC